MVSCQLEYYESDLATPVSEEQVLARVRESRERPKPNARALAEAQLAMAGTSVAPQEAIDVGIGRPAQWTVHVGDPGKYTGLLILREKRDGSGPGWLYSAMKDTQLHLDVDPNQPALPYWFGWLLALAAALFAGLPDWISILRGRLRWRRKRAGAQPRVSASSVEEEGAQGRSRQ